MGDIKVIAAGLGLESRRAIRCDPIAESAFGATKFAGAADLLGQFFIAPCAVDQNAHILFSRVGRKSFIEIS
jgi:hypothetical protein